MAKKPNKSMPGMQNVKSISGNAAVGIAAKKRQFDIRILWWISAIVILAILILFRDLIKWSVAKDFLAIFLSWPPVALVLGLTFMARFRGPIETFLSKLDHMKAAGVEISQQQVMSTKARGKEATKDELEKELDKNKENNDGSITLTKDQVNELQQTVQDFEFRYLDAHLVQNTKTALKLMRDVEVQRPAFLQIYQVPPNVLNPEAERYAILESLTSSGLAMDDRGIMKVTEKGMRFLEYEGIK